MGASDLLLALRRIFPSSSMNSTSALESMRYFFLSRCGMVTCPLLVTFLPPLLFGLGVPPDEYALPVRSRVGGRVLRGFRPRCARTAFGAPPPAHALVRRALVAHRSLGSRRATRFGRQ